MGFELTMLVVINTDCIGTFVVINPIYPQESEVLSIIKYRGTSKIAEQL